MYGFDLTNQDVLSLDGDQTPYCLRARSQIPDSHLLYSRQRERTEVPARVWRGSFRLCCDPEVGDEQKEVERVLSPFLQRSTLILTTA